MSYRENGLPYVVKGTFAAIAGMMPERNRQSIFLFRILKSGIGRVIVMTKFYETTIILCQFILK